jgi:hypothetical protein
MTEQVWRADEQCAQTGGETGYDRVLVRLACYSRVRVDIVLARVRRLSTSQRTQRPFVPEYSSKARTESVNLCIVRATMDTAWITRSV